MTEAADAFPMFPLGMVLFPGAVLPLRIFEPRYRLLAAVLLSPELEIEPEFGVVLIQRGREVGGFDQRYGAGSAGTVARIVQASGNVDVGYRLVTVGTRRIRVGDWLPDDPYPRAIVEDWPDDDEQTLEIEAVETVIAQLRRILAMKAELGEAAAPPTFSVSSEPNVALWQACSCAPFGPADQLRLLGAPGAEPRLALLRELIGEEAAVLSFRLSTG